MHVCEYVYVHVYVHVSKYARMHMYKQITFEYVCMRACLQTIYIYPFFMFVMPVREYVSM